MLKRLLALFARKKPTAQQTFEEKLERLGGYQPTPKLQRPTSDTRHVDRHGFSAPARRGMTVNQASSSRLQMEDMALHMMMQQTYVAPSPIRSHDDNCLVDHTPSHRHSDPDPSPSYDGGSDSGYSGGSGCD